MKTFFACIAAVVTVGSFILPGISNASEGEWHVVNCCGMKEIRNNLKKYTLKGIWGSSGEDVFVVGEYKTNYERRGLILYHDGKKWRIIKKTKFRLTCVWGTSPSDVFVGGGNREGSIILHYNGTEWSQMEFKHDPYYRPQKKTRRNRLQKLSKKNNFFGGGPLIVSICGSSENDVFAVGNGYGGPIFHFDGQIWERMDSDKSPYLRDISGNSAHNIYAVGESGTGKMMYYDGISWTQLRKGEFNSIWCSRFGVVFAAGKRGRILRYNLKTWDETDLGTTIYDLYGIASNDVYAVGKKGFIYQFDGTTWYEMYSGIENNLYAIWVNSPTKIYAVGDHGIILKFGKNHSSIETLEEESSKKTSEVEAKITYEIRLKDGRRIITKMHWEENDSIYYYKFGATVSLPKADIEEIVVVK